MTNEISQRIKASIPDDPQGKNKAICSNCGSPRTARLDRANANDGDIPVWDFRCRDCGVKFPAILISLPVGFTSLSALDGEHRAKRKRILRLTRLRKRAAKGLPVLRVTGKPRGNIRTKSDYLQVQVTINRGEVTGPTAEQTNGPRTFLITPDNSQDDPIWPTVECVHCGHDRTYKFNLCSACINALERGRPQRKKAS